MNEDTKKEILDLIARIIFMEIMNLEEKDDE